MKKGETSELYDLNHMAVQITLAHSLYLGVYALPGYLQHLVIPPLLL